jgi:hypothetical protein
MIEDPYCCIPRSSRHEDKETKILNCLGAVHLIHHYHKRTESTLFHNPPLPLKVYKSSEKNDDGGRFHEIKHADDSGS